MSDNFLDDFQDFIYSRTLLCIVKLIDSFYESFRKGCNQAVPSDGDLRAIVL